VPVPHTYSAATDISGGFEIKGVVPGKYFVLGRLQGYLCSYDVLRSEYDGDAKPPTNGLNASLMRVTVASGQTANITITLSRGASLGGTVSYDDGAAAINLPVHLFRKDSAGVWKGFTNSYKVMVTLREAVVVPTTITGQQSLKVSVTTGDALRVFNGGKFRLRDAPEVDLQEGEERTDVDLSIPTTGLRTVRGVVVKQTDQQPITAGAVRLLDPQDKSLLRETTIQVDGSFVLDYVPDGSYLINVEPGRDRNSSHGYAALTVPLNIASDLSDLNYGVREPVH
jgi:hypothetical protein